MKDFYKRFFKSFTGLVLASLLFLMNTQEATAQTCEITCPIATPESFVMDNGVVVNADTIVFPPFPPAVCDALVSWPQPTTTFCTAPSSVTQTTGPDNGTIIDVGFYTITYVATSSNGNDTCSFTLAVIDTVNPTITWQTSNQECPNDITVYQEQDTCGAHVSWIAPVASDACGIDSFVSNYNSGDFIPAGVNTITYLATDLSGNTNECSFTITVEDTTDPVITFCPPDTTVNTGVDSCSRWVTMPDLVLDEECPAAINWTVTGAGATPAAGAGTQVAAEFNEGTSTVNFAVDDGSGNTTSCSFDVTVVDNQAPTVTCNNAGPETFGTSDDGTGDCTYDYTDDIDYNENCNADITYTINNDGSIIQSGTLASNVSGTANLTPTWTLPSGNNIITYTITDDAGNSSQCAHLVVVEDDEAPAISSCGPNGIIGTDAPDCSADVTLTADFSDNCLVDSVTYSVVGDTTFTGSSGYIGAASGTFTEVITFSPGTYGVTFTAHDSVGQTAICLAIFTVVDDDAPVLSGCTDTTIYVDGNCEAIAGWTEPTAEDNCDANPTVTQVDGITQGSTQGPGTYTITYEAEDANGNTSTCDFDVIVVDSTSPVIIDCPVDTTIYADANCEVVYEFTVPDTSDNCGITSYVATGAGTGYTGSTTPGNVETVTLNAGVYTYTYTATDAAGNSTVCEFVVTVEDTTAPEVTCPNDVTAFNDEGECFATVDAYSVDTSGTYAPVGGAGTAVALTDDDVSGALPIGFTFNFYGRTYTDFYISSNGFITFSAGQPNGCCFGRSLPTAGAPNNLIAFGWADLYPPGGGTVEYFTTGTSPNSTLIVNFTGVPHCCSSGNGNASVQLQLHESSNRIEIHTTDYTMPSYPNFVTVGVENIDGSLGTAEPGFNSTLYSSGTTLKTNDYVAFEPTFPFVTDNCTEEEEFNYSWTASNTSGFAASGTGLFDGEQFPITQWDGGSDPITVTYTVSDTAGNTETCSYTLDVTDEEEPTISCPGPIAADNDPDTCGATLAFTVTANDNCNYTIHNDLDGQTSTNEPLEFDGFVPQSVDSIMFVVTDTAGFTDTCYVEVSIADTQAPDLECPPDIVQTVLDSTVCYDIIGWTTPTPPDNCDPNPFVTQTTSFNNPDLYAVGHYVVEYQSTDASGNTATCSFTIDVIDNVPPVITDCPNDTTVMYDPAICGANVNWDAPNASDNCPGVLLTTNHAPGSYFPTGSTVVRYIASDTSGNADTCEFTVTVIDTTAPTIACPADLDIPNDSGMCSASVTVDYPAITEDCNVDSVWTDRATLNVNRVMYGADQSGNYFSFNPENGSVDLISSTFNDVTEIEYNPITEQSIGQYPDGQFESFGFEDSTGQQTTGDVFNGYAFTGLEWIGTQLFGAAISLPCDSSELRLLEPSTGSTTLIGKTGLDRPLSGLAYDSENDILYGVTGCGTLGTSSLYIINRVDGNATFVGNTGVVLGSLEFGPEGTLYAGGAQVDAGNIYSIDPTSGASTMVASTGLGTPVTGLMLGGYPGTISDVFAVGSHEVTIYVKDNHDNIDSCVWNVTVNDVEPPVLECPPDITVNTDPGECDAFVSLDTLGGCVMIPGFTGYYAPSNWTVIQEGNGSVDVSNAPDSVTLIGSDDTSGFGQGSDLDNGLEIEVSCDGQIEFSWDYETTDVDGPEYDPFGYILNGTFVQLTDDLGPDAQSGFETVAVSEGDTFGFIQRSEDDVFGAATTVTASFTAPTTLGGVSDNCGIASIVNDFDGTAIASGTYPLGTTTVTYTVTDIHGNVSTCSFDVTVVDNEPPMITCPNDTIVDTDPGMCSTELTFTEPTPTDNCGIDTFYHDSPYGVTAQDASGTYPRDTTVVTYTVVDVNGNTTTCDFTVIVQDNEDPVIACSDTTFETDPGKCYSTQLYELPEFSDNCPDPWLTLLSGPAQGDTLPTGTYTVAYMVTDSSGNTATCDFTINVIDTEPPETNCIADIETTNDPGICGAKVDYLLQSPSDNCLIASVVQTDGTGLTAGDTFPVGVTVQTYVVTDTAGNTNDCSFTITVTDDEAPVIANCPADTVVTNDSTNCSAVVTYTPPTITDNCSVTVTSSHDPGDVFPVGTTTVTYFAEDPSGNTASCSFDITVEDNEDPVMACQDDTLLTTDLGECGAVFEYDRPVATDNCGFTEYFFDFETGAQGWTTATLPGSTVDYWNVYNTVASSGNNSYGNENDGTLGHEHSYIVSPALFLTDESVSLTFDSYINNESGTSADVEYVEVSTDGGATWTTIHAVPTPELHSPTTSTWNTLTYSFTGAPAGQATYLRFRYNTMGNTGNAPDPGVEGWYVDNVSIVNDDQPGTLIAGLPSGSQFPVGTTTNVFEVVDDHGNTTTCSFDVTVEDDEAPVIAGCPSDTIVSNDAGMCSAVVSWTEPTASDNCEVASFTSNYSPGDTFPVGTTTVTYIAEDSAGNTSECSFDITVEDNEAPVANCPGDISASADQGACETEVTWTFDATDNCNVASITSTHESGDIFPVGTTTVTYTVTDDAGNTDECSFDVTVTDDEDPVITACPSDMTVSNDATLCSAVVTYPDVTATDNCPGVTVTQTAGLASGEAFPVGETTVIYTATDASGNTATCGFTVTVEDTEPPVATCLADTILENDPGECEADFTYTIPVDDNCPGATITYLNGGGTMTNESSALTMYGVAGEPSLDTTTQQVLFEDLENWSSGNPDGSSSYNGWSNLNGFSAPDWTVDDDGTTSGSTGPEFDHTLGTEDGQYVYLETSSPASSGEWDELTSPAIDLSGFNLAELSFWYHMHGDDMGTLSVEVSTDGSSWTEEFSISGEQHFDESDPWSQATVDLSGYAGNSTVYLKFIGTREGSFHGDMALDDFSVMASSITATGASLYRIDAPTGASSAVGNSGTYGVVRSIDWEDNSGLYGGTQQCNLIEIDKYDAAESLIGNNANCIGANYSLDWIGGTLYGINVDTNTAVETIHTQNFSGQNGKGATGTSIDLSGVDWDIDVSNANLVDNNDWFRVENGEFEAHDLGGEAIWYSEAINIFPYSTVSFSIDVNEDGDLEDNDYVDVSYSTDGGSTYTTITNWNGFGSATHTFIGDLPDDDDWQSATVSASGLSGTDLIIRVTVKNDDPNEDVQFDNLHVEGSPLHVYTLGTFDNSGNFSAVATITPGVELQNGLAYNPNNNTLYGLGLDNSLYDVDINTGDATLIGNTGVSNLRTLDYNGDDGMLYTSTASGDIYTIDASTGSATFVSSTGIADMKSVTFVEMSTATSAQVSGTYPVGTTTEEFIIIDAHGNSTTCDFDITVEDTEDPVITTCPGNIMEETTPGICGAIVVYNTPEFTDNCGASLSLVSGLPNGSEFPLGTTTQVYEVEDAAGNVVTCSFDVTVEDTEAPEITCPEDFTVSNDPGVCGAFVSVTQTITLIDEDLEDWSTGNPNGSSSYNGWSNVNSSTPDWTVDAGGTTSGSTGPDIDHTLGTSSGQYIYLETSSSSTGEFDELYSPVIDVSTLSGAELSFWYHMHGSAMGTLEVDVSTDGVNWTQEFSISGEQHSSETDPWTQATVNLDGYVGGQLYIRFVGIRGTSFTSDMALDDILLTGEASLSIDNAVSATDNCPGVQFEQVGGIHVDSMYPVGTSVVTFMATDAAGNTSTCSVEVTVEDNEVPDIECPVVGDTTIYASDSICGAEFSFPMATAADTCGIDNVVQSDGINSGGVFPVGTNTVVFTATDVNGNTATCSFDVIVVDTFAPVIACTDTVLVPNDINQCEAIVTVPNPDVDEACDYSITNDYNGTGSATDIYPLGTTIVEFLVEDASGNTATCQTVVVVVDTQAPTISCPANVVVDNDPGLCGAVVEYDAPGYDDNCPGEDTTLLTGPNTASQSFFPVGTTTVAYMVTDAAGNTATCSFTITVEDTEGPQFSFCPGDTVISTDPGQCAATATWPVPFAFDNCGTATMTSSHDPGESFPLGTTTVTYTATDTAGNTSQCQFDITVVDETPPVIAGCPDDIETCDPEVSWTEPTATDNCALDTMYSSHQPGMIFPIGTTEVYYVAIDSAGNSDTCSFNVTVHPLPVADAGADVSICNGESATIGGNPTGSVTGGFSYSWSPATGLDDPTAANPVASPTATTTYEVVVTDSNGCTDEDQVTVTVLPLPTADAGDDQTICLNESVTIGGSPTGSGTTGNYSYSWSPSNGLSSTTVANPSASPEATTTYTVEVTDNNGCASTSEVTVTVNPLPDATIDSVSAMCENGPNVTLTAATTGGTWSGPGIIDASNGTFDPSAAGAGIHTVEYTVQDANGCSNDATMSIEVMPTPDISIIGTGPYCETDEPVFLTATPFYNDHMWFGPGIVNGTTGEFDPEIAGDGQHEIFYTVTGPNGCADTSSTLITVYESPDIDIDAAGPFCENEPEQVLTANINGGTWSGPGIIQSQLGQFLPIAAGAGVHQISYTVTNSNQCTSTETTIITVYEVPSISGNISEATCEESNDGAVNLDVVGGDQPYDFLWSNGETTEDLEDVAAGTYDVTVTDQNGCISTASFTVGVSTQPVNASAVIKPADNNVTDNGEIDVTVTGGVPPYTFSWSNGDTDPEIDGLYPGTYELTIIDAAGCSYEFSFKVPARNPTGLTAEELDESINLFPNPTNDVINIEIEVGQESDLDMTVFDMLGRKMYEVHDKISGKYSHQIGMEEWASGQYMIRFNIDGESVTRKYVLTK